MNNRALQPSANVRAISVSVPGLRTCGPPIVSSLLLFTLAGCGGSGSDSGSDSNSGPRSYSVGGTVSGLLTGTSLGLTNGSTSLTINSNGSFTLAGELQSGSTYSVAIGSQPAGETCALSNGSGTVAANVSNVVVACTPNKYSIGGTVSGLATGASIALENNGSDVLTVQANGSFTFTTPIAAGSTYAVTVTTQASGQNCTVGQGSGTVRASAVSGVAITCAFVYSASPGNWTWMSGSSTTGAPGVYGALGVASGASTPGARFEGVAWTGTDGSFWLFGGSGYAATNSGGGPPILNDLWKYQPSTGVWTWVSGPSSGDVYGVYGTRGVPAATNLPQPRTGAVSWIDAAGHLWLFGGNIVFPNAPIWPPNTEGNDLWEFDPSTGYWTWVSGPSGPNGSEVRGTTGVASASVVPGAGQGGVGWTDASGNLWLFGGYSYAGPQDSQTFQLTNELWMFTPATGLWTFEGNGAPVARWQATAFTDAKGNHWLFGGVEAQGGSFNDLWEFFPSLNAWRLVGGSTQPGATGVYGTKGVPSTSNIPGARNNAVGWADSSGNLWLFGGVGPTADPTTIADFNDLWEFDPTAGTWTWVSGSNTTDAPGVYGTLGVASPTNVPGARDSALAWTDQAGNLWLFGGAAPAPSCCVLMNDLWVYTP